MRSGRIEAWSLGTELALSWRVMSALPEARESLTYWEGRLERLPRRAVRKRREAREMTLRWRERVSEAERLEYGAGVLGALLLFLSERRLPLGAHQTGRKLVRVGAAVAATVVLALVTVLVIAGLIAVEVLRALF
jgi:hypothetical protein